jgi:hypothetical protein
MSSERTVPQRLKPASTSEEYGTADAVPLQNTVGPIA